MQIEKFNESHVRVFASRDVLSEIKDYFTFKAPNYRFHPKYKARLWDGNISMFNLNTGKLPIGLVELLLTYAERAGEEVQLVENQAYTSFFADEIDFDEFKAFVEGLEVSNAEGQRIYPEDYQIDAAYIAMRDRRCALEMPTGSGKSLTIYIMIRWLIEHGKRISLIVPSIALVNQMASDFMEYSVINGFDVEGHVNMLFSGQEKTFDAPVLISTWQSIAAMCKKKYGQQVVNSYDAIIVDEAHNAKGPELQKIMLDMATDVPYKIGTTGTVSKDTVNRLTIIGCLGPVHVIKKTKELMEEGKLTQLTIRAVVLKYPDEECKHVIDLDYDAEMSYIAKHEKRRKMIAKMCAAAEGTTLVLARKRDDHVIPLYETIKDMIGHIKPVYVIHGKISAEERERTRKLASQHDCVIVATYQTASTGINIPRIDTVIFASSSKSDTQIIQSIGRGIRRFLGKTRTILIDIVDDFRYKKRTKLTENTAFKHFLERMKIYRAEEHDVEIIEMRIK